ncbi:hypothetical protein CBL_07728 [Carabus blaptoides fortunei]
MAYEESCIARVSVCDSFRIHLLSFVIGVWVVFKRFARWAWDPNTFFSLRVRDNPPACLVDSTLGRHSYVKLKGAKLHYVEAGNKNQPLLLFLHGFPDCWLSWRNQIISFAEHFHVIALDMKGFGDSDKPLRRRNYRVDILLEELRQFIAAQGVTSCILVGHDLGALLGWYFVHQFPELIEKFVAVSCTHPNLYWDNLSGQSNFNSWWMSFIQLPYLPEMDALREDVRIITDCYKHLQPKDSKDALAVIEAYKYSFSRTEDWTGPINYFRNLPFQKICDNSAQITVPTLLVTGNRDHFVKLEGAGHFPHQESPEMFNRILLNYLHIGQSPPKTPDKTLSKGIMNRMFGAVSSTVKYGNSVLDSVQKRTNGVVSIPSRALNLNSS